MAFQAMSWHSGEEKIHRLTHLPPSDNPTHSWFPPQLVRRVQLSPTIAIGTIDSSGDVWCTLWGGDLPIAQQVAQGGILGIRVAVDASFDPVIQAIYGDKQNGEPVRPVGKDVRMVSGLSILLEERDRVKFFGMMIAGALQVDEGESNSQSSSEIAARTGTAQLVVQVSQSLGNCPKYLNKKTITGCPNSSPRLLSRSPVLTKEAIDHVHAADVFFIASRGPEDMDCNHRGGPPGFIRVEPQQDKLDGSVLVWPEYGGNNLYQTLGNIMHDPSVGLVIPNIVTGDVLYLSGHAEVLVSRAAADIITKSKLAIRLKVKHARYVREGLMFRGRPIDGKNDKNKDGYSPYNPRVRLLVSELSKQSVRDTHLPPDEYQPRTDGSQLFATMVKKNKLTPTITKYRFKLSSNTGVTPSYRPGQYIILDLSEEMYSGYSHMRDDDPSSLNDDYIRSFTVSSRHNDTNPLTKLARDEFELTIRTVGSVTRWLTWQNENRTTIGVKGFEGEFRFELPDIKADRKRRKNVFVAAGIGITPLLSQVADLEDHLIVLWSVGAEDIGLVEDVLKICPEPLKRNTRLFVTRTDKLEELGKGEKEMLGQIETDGLTKVYRRRMTKQDIAELNDGEYEIDKWYLCTTPKMRQVVQEWLGKTPLIYENFDY